MQDFKPDRIFIEPTGIGEPESMVNLLNNDYFAKHFDIKTIFAVLDSKISKVEHFKQMTIMQNLLDVADVIIFNKTDTADPSNLKKLNQYANELYPPKKQRLSTHKTHLLITVFYQKLTPAINSTNFLYQILQTRSQTIINKRLIAAFSKPQIKPSFYTPQTKH